MWSLFFLLVALMSAVGLILGGFVGTKWSKAGDMIFRFSLAAMVVSITLTLGFAMYDVLTMPSLNHSQVCSR